MALGPAQFKYGQAVQMVDHTPGADVDAGNVVIVGSLALICHVFIKAAKLGALAFFGGTYKMPKEAAGSGKAIGPCVQLYWDVTNQRVDLSSNSSANKPIGFSGTAGALTTDTYVMVHHKPW